MTKRTRRNHGPAFKAKVALAAVKGEKTLADRPTKWRTDLSKIGVQSSGRLDHDDR